MVLLRNLERLSIVLWKGLGVRGQAKGIEPRIFPLSTELIVGVGIEHASARLPLQNGFLKGLIGERAISPTT